MKTLQIKNIFVAILVVATMLFGGWRILTERPTSLQSAKHISVGMSKIQVRWYLGKPHHTLDSTKHDSWWYASSESSGAPTKYFNVVFGIGSVEHVDNTNDLSRPALLKQDEAPLPRKKIEKP
jgi:outer membrane protein assembly factor BamE (lipoprotein component of BamABCDE complex)